MATIQPIEGNSVHRIQSGQVIVDLCSVVKELVENSLDAGATTIEVRFKNHGLDSIEVQDNGSGIAKDDYESIALKHYTSKLHSYEDLTALNTFGFRGEAISSLCALSDVHILTATEHEAPKGSKLVFETSGKLKSTQMVAAQRGTTVAVETIFKNLPVRRQESVKNIKREYGKVLGLLQAYACISTGVKMSASNLMNKKKSVVFSTKANKTTRENIANVFGAKTLSALVPLDLSLELQSSTRLSNEGDKGVKVLGHVSRPVVGEGRQTPDRQMFFVNSRPCALPQVAKVMNEVYKSYNLSQSAFIFADVQLDTNAYDVNVSPDKRTILLHEQGALLESVKETLTELFDNHQQTVPQSHKTAPKLLSFKSSSLNREASMGLPDISRNEVTPSSETREVDTTVDSDEDSDKTGKTPDTDQNSRGLHSQMFANKVQDRIAESPLDRPRREVNAGLSLDKQRLVNRPARQRQEQAEIDEYDELSQAEDIDQPDSIQQTRRTSELDEYDDVREDMAVNVIRPANHQHIEDFNARIASQQEKMHARRPDVPPSPSPEPEIPSISSTPAKPPPGVMPNAFDRMRPMRAPKQTATITIGNKTTTSTIGSSALRMSRSSRSPWTKSRHSPKAIPSTFASSLKSFAAADTQYSEASDDGEEDDEAPVARSVRSSIWGRSPSARTSLGASRVSEDELDELSEDRGNDAPQMRASSSSQRLPSDGSSDDGSDEEWLTEEAKKEREDAKVARLIEEAEEKAARPSEESSRRAQNLLKGGHKEATTRLIQTLDLSVQSIEARSKKLQAAMAGLGDLHATNNTEDAETAEERLSLTVSKEDFSRMHIVGQFNLGFIIAVRPNKENKDELFIIDQHASDEKSNFERLQATTVVQNQRLVQPQALELTAIEEELIMDNQASLLRNGFIVNIDESGDKAVGNRCTLASLPMSREVTFSSRDLEELLVLLSDSKDARPSKVRKIFAMRACRSSVMIGKALPKNQMEKLVRNMGTIDKPWNCPHGRPTMRHLFGLGAWEGWQEGMGLVGLDDEAVDEEEHANDIDWSGWISQFDEDRERDDAQEGDVGEEEDDTHMEDAA